MPDTGLELREVFQVGPDSLGVPIAEQPSTADVHAMIEAAYRELADGPGDYVRLHELRELLPGIGEQITPAQAEALDGTVPLTVKHVSFPSRLVFGDVGCHLGS